MDPRAQSAYDAIKSSKVSIDIPKQSKTNLVALRNMTLTKEEGDFYRRCLSLPFILEHRSKSGINTGWHAIKGITKKHGGVKKKDAKLLSLFELSKLMYGNQGKTSYKSISLNKLTIQDVDFSDIKTMLGNVQINTSQKDFDNFGNVDFVFFKLNLVGGHVSLQEGFAGVAKGKPKHFSPEELYYHGWISLDDWVSYSAGGNFTNDLKQVWSGFVQNGLNVAYGGYDKTYTYTSYTKYEPKLWLQHNVLKNKPVQIKKNIKDEVFFAEDIRPGFALTLIEHLRAADPSGEFIKRILKQNFIPQVAKLAGSIWRLIEAKLPGTLLYYDHKISKDVAVGKKTGYEDYFK